MQQVGMKHRKAIKQGLLRNFGFMLFPFDMYDLDSSEDDILDDFFNSKIVDSVVPKHMFKTYTLSSIEQAIKRAFKRQG